MATSTISASSIRFSAGPLNPNKNGRSPPITISTNPCHVNVTHLRDLLHAAGHSCDRFPSLGADGRPEPVDLEKLGRAVENSSVVVSVFCRQNYPDGFTGFEQIFERVVSVPGPDSQLVGFGRAVSDGGLTASIHDVVVIPSLRRLAIGRRIVQRLVRVLTSRDIYDISALCSAEERLFFRACGFGDDVLESITMMYTRTTSAYSDDAYTMRRAATAVKSPRV